jgi:hypothetical protein
MRLTIATRQAFVLAVLNDVPQIDYQAQIEKLALEFALTKLPAEVVKVWNNKKTRQYINTELLWLSFPLNTISIPAELRRDLGGDFRDQNSYQNILELAKKQKEELKALKTKLEGIANSVNTTERLAQLVPELVEYIPNDSTQTITSLPAVTNLIPDLKMAGWPKHETKKISV